MSNLLKKSDGVLKVNEQPEQQWLEPEAEIKAESKPEDLVCEKGTSFVFPLNFNQELEFSKFFYFAGLCALLLLAFFIFIY